MENILTRLSCLPVAAAFFSIALTTTVRAAPSANDEPGPGPAPEAPPAEAPTAAAPAADAPPAVVFDRIRAFAGRENPGLYAALDGGRLVERAEDRLRIAAPNRFAAQRLEARRDVLAAACSSLFGRAVSVEIEAPPEPVAAGRPVGAAPERLRQLRQQALNHPCVSMTVEILEGEIAEIRPLGDGR